MYYLDNGIKKLEQKNLFKRFFCKHEFIDRSICSESGLLRISGDDRIVLCKYCGKVKGIYSKE
ncbi:hypothetical protein [Clostridium sp. B9]|uniref:hypothetical protein n=1 Tax=Clostridium sp. B9 TaxID=3423224 RepID=UPI003D2EDD02